MEILVLGRSVPSPAYPMEGIFEYQQAAALSAAGHSVTYFAADLRSLRRRRKLGYTRSNQDGIDVHLISLPVGPIHSRVRVQLMAALFDAMYKRAYPKKAKPDVAHAHFLLVAAAAVKSKNLRRVPLVATEHSSSVMAEAPSEGILELARLTYPRVDSLISVSATLASRIRDITNVKAKIVPNVVDAQTFRREPVQHDGVNILSVGSLSSIKRMHDVVAAYNIARTSLPGARLQIIGDGPERARLERYIESESLGEEVTLDGQRSQDYVASSLARSDIFVLASSAETFGVVLIEAMAAGVPVVATRSGGPEEFLQAESSRIVPVGDVEAIAEAIIDLYGQSEGLPRDAVSQWTVGEFGPEAVSSRLEAEYQTVISSWNGSPRGELR